MLVRLFVACTTFLLLICGVLQQEDHDGYKGVHLFFMPRENWEMDEGRGMLHEEEYYLEREYSFGVGKHEFDLDSGHDNSGPEREFATMHSAFGTNSAHAASVSLESAHETDPSSNELPFLLQVSDLPFVRSTFIGSTYLSALQNTWTASTPTPPPRSRGGYMS